MKFFRRIYRFFHNKYWHLDEAMRQESHFGNIGYIMVCNAKDKFIGFTLVGKHKNKTIEISFDFDFTIGTRDYAIMSVMLYWVKYCAGYKVSDKGVMKR